MLRVAGNYFIKINTMLLIIVKERVHLIQKNYK